MSSKKVPTIYLGQAPILIFRAGTYLYQGEVLRLFIRVWLGILFIRFLY